MDRRGMSAGTVLYLVIGIVVAANRGYLAAGIHTLGEFLTLLLVVVLWPLILLGVNLTITL